jgi:ABC-2 type transport system ATP-binding protein
MTTPIEVHDLTRLFGNFVAVDRVSFSVRQGEIFGFLGPNGAGKTTTIKMLNGLLKPTSGTAQVAGFDVARDPVAVKQNIGYMSQLFSLYGDLTVDENISLFGGLYGLAGTRLESRREWVLNMAELVGQRRRLTRELPLGWKQRLALGCAVLHEPPILFLDEPTSGVDPISRRRFWDMIYQLTDGGTTVLVTTHYMEEAEYCYRLALMNRGRLIALDRPQALKRELHQPILEIATDDAPRAVEALQHESGVVQAAMYGRLLHVMVEDQARALRDLPALLVTAGRTCDTIKPIDPTLEDVFVALIHREGGAVAG